MSSALPDLEVGRTFGRLTVLERADDRGHSHYYLCRCTCGNNKAVAKHALTKGETRSCGCLQREQARLSNRLRPFQSLYNVLLASGRNRGLVSTLTLDEFVAFTATENCHYCGAPINWIPFSTDKRRERRGYNVDRKDNALGYSVENCVVCCKRCNQSRMANFSYEEWRRIGAVIRQLNTEQEGNVRNNLGSAGNS